MKFIPKERHVPEAFLHLVNGIGSYDGLYNDIKKEIKTFLINEQKGLCAYCNQKIVPEKATIEHLICQSHNRNMELNYYNLYAVCEGSQGIKQKSHCDKYRANTAENDYFFPFILFEGCKTTSWNELNPFFDVEFNRKTGVISGRIKGRQKRVAGYPPIDDRIAEVIGSKLNLNSEILVEARKVKWQQVLEVKNRTQKSWEELFDFYLNLIPNTDFQEFVLMSLRKQVE